MKKKANKNRKLDILTAARIAIATNGYESATIKVIANDAKISRGLIHYYFKDKEEIIIEIFEKNVEYSLNLLNRLFEKADSLDDLVEESLTFVRHLTRGDSSPLNLFIEGLSYARRNEKLANSMKRHYRQFRSTIHDGFKKVANRGIIEPSITMDKLSILYLSIIDGIIIQIRNEPELFSEKKLRHVISKALHALLLPC